METANKCHWEIEIGDAAQIDRRVLFFGTQLAAVRRLNRAARGLDAGKMADLYRVTPEGRASKPIRTHRTEAA